MAIDTRNKRAGAQLIGLVWRPGAAPAPDSSLSGPDLGFLAGSYSHLEEGDPDADAPGWSLNTRSTTWKLRKRV